MRVVRVNGVKTLFYDGSRRLYNEWLDTEWSLVFAAHLPLDGSTSDNDPRRKTDDELLETFNVSDRCKRYMKKRLSWQQVVILDGITEIPEFTFSGCKNIKRVIFAGTTVIRIERYAFYQCTSLTFVKWPLNLQSIGRYAFYNCILSSVFIPPRCREIGGWAFVYNKNMTILNVPQNAELGENIIVGTALAEASPYEVISEGSLEDERADPNMNQWLKNMNNDEAFSLHRACSSFYPLKEVIHTIIQEQGLKAFREKNSAGITPSKYLKENPYTSLDEKEIIHEYLMKMMGECE